MATNYGKVATSASQQAQNKSNLASALKALSKSGGTATAAQNIYSGGGTQQSNKQVPVGNQTTSAGRSPIYGTSSSPAGSGSPVGMTKTPVLGTTGNPAGSQLPVGMSKANTKAATTASAIGTTKKPDWQLQMESINRSSGPIDETGTGSYGMTKDPTSSPAMTMNPGFKAANNLIENPPAPISYEKLMTRDPNYVAPKPVQNQASAFDAFSALQKTSSGNNTNQYSSPVQKTTATPPPSSQAPTPSTFGLDNTKSKAPAITEIQAAQGIADELTNQSEVSKQALDAVPVGDQYNEERQQRQRQYEDSVKEANAAKNEVKRLTEISPEEQQTQAQLDAELQSLELGKLDSAGQPIPLKFITGQQEALERKSLLRTQPLSSKLGKLQAARQAALSAAKFSSGIEENRLGTAESNLTAISTEERKRKNQLQDQTREDKVRAEEQANIDRKFQEDKRQFGIETAQKNREIAVKELDAQTNSIKNSSTSGSANELKSNALTSANSLLEKFNSGTGTSAVGGSRLLGLQNVPGSSPRDFEVQFNNLKSLLSLDNVKLLKGQGAVSDAERQLLERASSKLDLAQSESEFKSALIDIRNALGSATGGNTSAGNNPLGI